MIQNILREAWFYQLTSQFSQRFYLDISILMKQKICPYLYVYYEWSTRIFQTNIFESFHKVDRDLQKYCHLKMSLT